MIVSLPPQLGVHHLHPDLPTDYHQSISAKAALCTDQREQAISTFGHVKQPPTLSGISSTLSPPLIILPSLHQSIGTRSPYQINLSQPSALAQVGSTGYRSPPAPPLLPHLRDLNFKEPFPDSSTQVTSVTPANSYSLARASTGDPGGVVCLQYMTKTFCGQQIAPMEAGLRVMFLVKISWHGQALVRLFFASHPMKLTLSTIRLQCQTAHTIRSPQNGGFK